MKKVPNIISTKDLSYIADMFQWNFVIAKKSLDYSNNVLDKDIKKEMEKVYTLHKDICNNLLNLLG